jgi:hypothetical protein
MQPVLRYVRVLSKSIFPLTFFSNWKLSRCIELHWLSYQPTWLVPVSVWIVVMGMRGHASLRSLSDKLHLRLPPTWGCELGSVWFFHRGAVHLEPPVGFPSSFAKDCYVLSTTCAWDVFSVARACARICKVWDLDPDWWCSELRTVVSGEY